ncbi:NAD(P)H-binding protein [Streptomyces tropicalis]|uniref:NAD(P)H-binding protein n=1 Tax=Streptomyces tropicalis TaxID=3034234 RepID=A0ABT6A1H8_9ACTN|nr:NAD(P)H-binding protein [Streptomyces tropicalis]MDF3298498.1 NAD(P)H-binding protein [Streptomyces tropicalis]
MILLTGGTGTVGRLVSRRLSGTAPLRLLTRDPSRVAPGPRLDVVGGDFADPAGLERALTGVRTALLVTADPLAPAHDENFLTAARRAGVRHVVKLSALAVTDPAADDLITRWQRGNERLLRASGMSWTLLRPRAFMSNTLSWARSVREEGVVRALGGSTAGATVDPGDIAEVAAAALLDPDGHAGRTHALTGPEPISPTAQTATLARLLGRPVEFVELTVAEARVALRSRYPAPLADALLASAERGRAGAKTDVHPTVPALLGRPARSYRDWAADHLAAFGG